MKKIFVLLILTLSLFTYSCGTIFKSDRIFKERSNNIDYDILILDSMGLLFFVAPGLILLGTDYITGALFLTPNQAKDRNKEFTPSIARDLIAN